MSVPTFSELLNGHMRRAGISDSELARAIGVQRQTIFRWKEGLVARPRVREDVLAVARKLRLTPAERDQLLLAGGFPPEEMPENFREETQGIGASEEIGPTEPASGVETAPAHPTPPSAASRLALPGLPDLEAEFTTSATATDRAKSTPWLLRRGWLLLVSTLLLLVAGVMAVRLYLPQPAQTTPTPLPTLAITPAATATPQPTPVPEPLARPGERLLLVAQFTGYTSERFNVAGRIAEELEAEIATAQLLSTTVVALPAGVNTAADAAGVLARTGAALIIWGEYDSGRVRTNLTLSAEQMTQQVDFPLTSPGDLVTTINEAMPAEVRMFALLTVGNLYPLDTFYAKAAGTFKEALSLHPSHQKTRALLNFYIALATSKGGRLEDLDAAIGYYTQALALNPNLHDALYNRGTLWLNRAYLVEAGSPEIERSLNAALADLSGTIQVRSRFAHAYLNRGIVYYERNQPGDPQAAMADFTQISDFNRRDHRGYYHRALAKIRAADPTWTADLTTTLTLTPAYPAALNGFCWGYALDQQPTLALTYCDQAVAIDPSASSRDGRAIALAQLGRLNEAARDLETYLAWIRQLRPPTLYARYRGPQVEGWLAALRRNQNPFDAATLAGLR